MAGFCKRCRPKVKHTTATGQERKTARSFRGSGRGVGDGTGDNLCKNSWFGSNSAKGYGRTLPPPRICLLAKHEHFASESAKFAPVPPFGRSRLLLHLNPNKKGNEKAHADWRVPFRWVPPTILNLGILYVIYSKLSTHLFFATYK